MVGKNVHEYRMIYSSYWKFIYKTINSLQGKLIDSWRLGDYTPQTLFGTYIFEIRTSSRKLERVKLDQYSSTIIGDLRLIITAN